MSVDIMTARSHLGRAVPAGTDDGFEVTVTCPTCKDVVDVDKVAAPLDVDAHLAAVIVMWTALHGHDVTATALPIPPRERGATPVLDLHEGFRLGAA